MGFWSSVGSFCSGVARAVGGAVSSVARAVSGAVRSVGSAIVNATRSTVNFMVEKARKWGEVLKGAFDGGVKGFKEDGLWGALKGAVKGGYDAWKGKKPEEEEELDDYIEQASDSRNTVETDSEVERLAGIIQNFIPALQRKFASNAPVESFEEYLRVDISMSFIRDLIDRISKMKDPSELSKSDRKFIVLIDKLVMDKPMDEADLQEFDAQVKQRYKKTLLLMGSEKLFALWTNEEEVCKQSVNVQRNDYTRGNLRLKELESRARYSLDLTEAEKVELVEIKVRLNDVKNEYEQARKYLNNIRIVTGVSEGLLQQAEAENSGTQIKERDRQRNDKAGAILVNLERKIDEIRDTGDLELDENQEAFLLQYVDLYMPDAVQRKNKMANEYVVEVKV